ncbi:hypothetical protein B6U66_05285 [Candidatus Bathyarchaeota archaeon ex4484_135]|nr:MAG: hypothetical protein B6U66_05285 [Candidatus Bathyarchaeota archaeon ex4484_135]
MRTGAGLKELPDRGVYTLVIYIENPLEVKVGSLDTLDFRAGFYLYTGSGMGSSGLKGRIKRHLGGRKHVFWHIDYLLEKPGVSIKSVVASGSRVRMECEVNKALMASLRAYAPFRGFGSSDCRSGCPAHLLFAGEEDPTDRVVAVYLSLGLKPVLLEVERELEGP